MNKNTFLKLIGAVSASESKVEPEAHAPLILLVGNLNVGKSALFNKLTGQYVTVSNYPGTTVEVSHGHCHHLSNCRRIFPFLCHP